MTVDDVAGLDAWEELQRRALDLDDTQTRAWRDAHDRALSADVPLRDWIAFLDGVPVAAAALFVGAGVAGIYNVATVPEARGRGIGRAVTAAALAEAVRAASAPPSSARPRWAIPVYRRLGFRDVSRLRSYARHLSDAHGPGPILRLARPAGSRTPSPGCSRRCRPGRADRG